MAIKPHKDNSFPIIPIYTLVKTYAILHTSLSLYSGNIRKVKIKYFVWKTFINIMYLYMTHKHCL